MESPRKTREGVKGGRKGHVGDGVTCKVVCLFTSQMKGREGGSGESFGKSSLGLVSFLWKRVLQAFMIMWQIYWVSEDFVVVWELSS